MATPLTDGINALIRYANEVTGSATDTTLSDAIETLIAGYGQGGGYNITKKSDGNAHLYLDVIDKYLTITVYIRVATNQGGVFAVDWGDGMVETYGSTVLLSTVKHTYAKSGFYHVVFKEIEPPSNPNSRYFGGIGNIYLLGGGAYPNRLTQCTLVGFEAGNWPISGGQTFSDSLCEKIYLGESNALSSYSFCNSTRLLKEVELPSTLPQISSRAFDSCWRLESIVIPQTVTNIGSYAFNNTGNITIHMTSEEPPTLDANAFKSNCTPTIFVPTGSLESYQTADNWAAYASSMLEEN